MKKKCIVCQMILLVWFFLDMIGVCVGDNCLVARSYRDDGVFFLIYLITVVLFVVNDSIGKWCVAIWTTGWFVTQFLCHEWYTIFGSGIMGTLEGKIKYYSETIKWLTVEGKYIPDVYHTIEHVLILVVIVTSYVFIEKSKGEKKEIEIQSQ